VRVRVRVRVLVVEFSYNETPQEGVNPRYRETIALVPLTMQQLAGWAAARPFNGPAIRQSCGSMSI